MEKGIKKINWYVPKAFCRQLRLSPDKISFVKSNITLSEEIGNALGGGKVAIGISKEKGAVFFRPEPDGYVMRKRGKVWVICAYHAQFAEELQKVIDAPRILQAVRHSDGYYGCYL